MGDEKHNFKVLVHSCGVGIILKVRNDVNTCLEVGTTREILLRNLLTLTSYTQKHGGLK